MASGNGGYEGIEPPAGLFMGFFFIQTTGEKREP